MRCLPTARPEKYHLYVTQASFHVVSRFAYASVIAWLLKNSDLQFSPAPRELYSGQCYPLLDDFKIGSSGNWQVPVFWNAGLVASQPASQMLSVTDAQRHWCENLKPHTSHLSSLSSTCPYLAYCAFSLRIKRTPFDFYMDALQNFTVGVHEAHVLFRRSFLIPTGDSERFWSRNETRSESSVTLHLRELSREVCTLARHGFSYR